MFQELTIENFRGIERLHIPDLRRVNLFVGRNNCGKSTVLEAAYLLQSGPGPGPLAFLARHRGQRVAAGAADFLRLFFHNRDFDLGFRIAASVAIVGVEAELTTKAEELRALGGDSPAYADKAADPELLEGLSVSQEWNRPGRSLDEDPVSSKWTTFDREFKKTPQRPASPNTAGAIFLSARTMPGHEALAVQYSKLLKLSEEGHALRFAQLVEPNLRSLQVAISEASQDLLVEIDGSRLPVAAFGEGFVRVLAIGLGLANSAGGIVLIDEIDNGLHYSAFEGFWSLLLQHCRRGNVQVFATTHNDEMMRAAFQQFGAKEDFAFFRIDRAGREHRVIGFDSDMLDYVAEANFEVRG